MNKVMFSDFVFMVILLVVVMMLATASGQPDGPEYNRGGIGGMLDGAMNTASQMTGGIV